MNRSRLLGVATASLLSFGMAGCGSSSTPLEPQTKSPKTVDRSGRKSIPVGPNYDQLQVAVLPHDGFLYASFDGEPTLALMDQLVPATERGPRKVLPGIGYWLKRLRQAAPGSALFPKGASLILAGFPGPAPELTPFDFCVAAPSSPKLLRAIEQLKPDASGKIAGEASHPHLYVTRGSVVLLSSRSSWSPPQGEAWYLKDRARVRQGVGAYAVVSVQEYLKGPFGERTRRRAPGEYRSLVRFAELLPTVAIELQTFRGGVHLDFWGDLAAGAERATEFTKVFSTPKQLVGPTLAPSTAAFFAAASLDWAALRSFAKPSTEEGVPRPTPEAQNPSPFQASHGRQVVSSGWAAWKAGMARIQEAIADALEDWGGPEVSFTATWDSQVPHFGTLIQSRRPKGAVAQIQRYRASEIGKKLRFADAEAFEIPYRYTRLDGVDPMWLEPSYGFVGRSLGITSSRKLLESFLDSHAPKLEENTALGGVFSRLGREVRVLFQLDPAVLPRVADFLARSKQAAGQPIDPQQQMRTQAPLEAFSKMVHQMALGIGVLDQAQLRASLVFSLRSSEAESPVLPSDPKGR